MVPKLGVINAESYNGRLEGSWYSIRGLMYTKLGWTRADL